MNRHGVLIRQIEKETRVLSGTLGKQMTIARRFFSPIAIRLRRVFLAPLAESSQSDTRSSFVSFFLMIDDEISKRNSWPGHHR